VSVRRRRYASNCDRQIRSVNVRENVASRVIIAYVGESIPSIVLIGIEAELRFKAADAAATTENRRYILAVGKCPACELTSL